MKEKKTEIAVITRSYISGPWMREVLVCLLLKEGIDIANARIVACAKADCKFAFLSY